MEPVEVVAEVSRRDAAVVTQHVLEAFGAAIDGLDVQFAADAFALGVVDRLVRQAEQAGAGAQGPVGVGDQHGIWRHGRAEHLGQGLGIVGFEHSGQGRAGAVGGDQHRHLFPRQAALGCLAAALARLATASPKGLLHSRDPLRLSST